MSRPSIRERIQALSSLEKDFPEYQALLNLHGVILETLITLEDAPSRGARESLHEDHLKTLKEATLLSKIPIIEHLNPSLFDEETILNTMGRIVECIIKCRPEGAAMVKLKEALDHHMIDASAAIKAIIKGDAIWFQKISKIFSVEPSFLLFAFSTPLQPFFEGLARRVGETFMETWFRPACPICGRYPIVARIKDKKRYMICTFCGAEYLTDQFLCTNCGNRDPNSLSFIAFEGHPEYELNYCEKCRHYIKVLREGRVNKYIIPGLEDLLTQELDRFAQEELNLQR